LGTDLSPVLTSPENNVTARNTWENVLGLLRKDGLTYPASQLEQFTPLAIDDQQVTLGVVDLFFRDFVDDNYGPLLSSALTRVLGKPCAIVYQKIDKGDAKPVLPLAPPVNQLRASVQLNNRFTFDSYVVSDSNQLPAAAAMAVADSPGKAYNPLFIYGGTGLGKTHLLHAIGNVVLSKNSNARVVYLSSEDFTNQFIESVRDQKMTQFRRRFREECDVLLIDDIQFLGKKQETQNEFFYTFNTLHHLSKAVVMTSDTVPSEIPGLEERLRSRFAMGLITDVHEPNFEARSAILKKKAAQENFELPDAVVTFVARNIVKNVRELEGALTKIMAVHALTKQPLTEALCAQVLKDVLPEKRAVDADAIQREVSRFYKIPVDDMCGERRVKQVALARQVAMYLVRTLTQSSLPEIGKKFNKDHSTVLSSVRKIDAMKETDAQLKFDLGELRQKLVHDE
jgi:chromosomal replication initiator protein